MNSDMVKKKVNTIKSTVQSKVKKATANKPSMAPKKARYGSNMKSTAMNTTDLVKKIKSNTKRPSMSKSTVGTAMNKAANVTGMKMPTSVSGLRKATTGSGGKSFKSKAPNRKALKSKARKIIKNWSSQNK